MFKEVELFIAQRIGDHSDRTHGIAHRIATVAVAMSLVVMIISLSIIFGFKREVHHKLTALSGEVIIAPVGGVEPSAYKALIFSPKVDSVVRHVARQIGVEVERVSPYVVASGVVQMGDGFDGVVFKGVDSTYDMQLFVDGLTDGEIPKFGVGESQRNVIISEELARRASLEVGSRLDLLVAHGGGGEMMQQFTYRVGAIYSAGLGDMESGVVIADIRNVRRINRWISDLVSGYEVSIGDLGAAPAFAEVLNRELLLTEDWGVMKLDIHLGSLNMAAYSAQEIYPSIFGWLAAHDVNGVVVVVVMTLVAIFNIITALLIMVMERSSMIGVLKALGMSSRAISRIFVYRAVGLTLRGMVLGNCVGLFLCWMQLRFGFLRLDEASYILTSVPIDLGVGWILVLNVSVVLVVFVTVLLPARLVSGVEPHRAIKFQ